MVTPSENISLDLSEGHQVKEMVEGLSSWALRLNEGDASLSMILFPP